MSGRADVGGEPARAHSTLIRGAHVLAGHDPLRLPPRVLANGLRELDRFLMLLIVAKAETRGLPSPRSENNAANALVRLRGPRTDDARLRALGRSRACLLHCAGVARRPDARGGDAMTLGWREGGRASGPLRRVALGAAIMLDRAQLADICAFYTGLADDVIG